MKLRNMTIISLAIVLCISAVHAVEDTTDTVDHKLFDMLLKKYVASGIVDYNGLKKEESVLDTYLAILEKVKPDNLSRNEQFAFYINLYNAWTIKLILRGYPDIESIKDMGSLFKSPWKKKIVRTNKGVVTLDYVEHEMLRPVFKDPRVHFAINCAAKSCPPLRAEAYRGDILEDQLNDSTISFMNDPQNNYLEGETLYISKIFDWFEEDFNGVHGFFLTYARGNFKKQLEKIGDKIEISHLDYNWDLNGM
jgi:Protein of unknown function, DUF547